MLIGGGYVGMLQDFNEFIKEYKVMPLAIAFIMGAAMTTLVQALVNDVVMPLVGALLPQGDWQSAKVALGPVSISWGHFLGALIYFIIIAFVVFMVAKMILKEEKVTKK
jgi:large conductance mechanosensitive channel